jgi:uncharacterized protein YbjT (DUF2867 family)
MSLLHFLVVGATGNLGSKIVRRLLDEKKQHRPDLTVAALVREGSDASKLEALGVKVIRGDMLDPVSLDRAFTGMDGVFMAAASYMARKKGDSANNDDIGNLNLAQAAKRANIKCFVLASVINAEKAPDAPQVRVKVIAEQTLQSLMVPFVSVRTGAFVDQGSEMYENDVKQNKLTSIGDAAESRYTMTTTQLHADTMVRAMFTPAAINQIIDVGFLEPLTTQELADMISQETHRQISVKTVPFWLVRGVLSIAGLFSEFFYHVHVMLLFIHRDGGMHFRGDFSTYERVFGEKPPPAQKEIAIWVKEKGLVL